MPKVKSLKINPGFRTLIVKSKSAEQKAVFPRVYLLSLCLSIVTIALPLVLKRYLPPEVPLYYGSAQGQDQLTGTLGLTIPGITSLTITMFNTGLAILMKNKFLQQVLLVATLLVSSLSLITVIKIILLVGSINL